MAGVSCDIVTIDRENISLTTVKIKGVSKFHQFAVGDDGAVKARELTNVGPWSTLTVPGAKLKPAALFAKCGLSKPQLLTNVCSHFPACSRLTSLVCQLFNRFTDVREDWANRLQAADGGPISANTTPFDEDSAEASD